MVGGGGVRELVFLFRFASGHLVGREGISKLRGQHSVRRGPAAAKLEYENARPSTNVQRRSARSGYEQAMDVQTCLERDPRLAAVGAAIQRSDGRGVDHAGMRAVEDHRGAAERRREWKPGRAAVGRLKVRDRRPGEEMLRVEGIDG